MSERVQHTAEKAQQMNHPDKPVMGDDEDYVAYLGRCADQWTKTPPEAPDGFERITCLNHWPLYTVTDDDFYPAPCPACVADSMSRTVSELRCRAEHRRWKSWRVLGWLSGKAYWLGLTCSGGVTYGRCQHCGIGRQHHRPRLRGKRPYILGVQRETWDCWRRGHRRRESHWTRGLCTVCLPCPDCGSTAPEHWSCDPATALSESPAPPGATTTTEEPR